VKPATDDELRGVRQHLAAIAHLWVVGDAARRAGVDGVVPALTNSARYLGTFRPRADAALRVSLCVSVVALRPPRKGDA
jgi:hypothetical protein